MSILIAEDNVAQRHYLKEILEKEFPSHAPVIEAADGEETVKLALEGKPEVCILDIQMPKLSGVKAARAIWRDFPTARIIFWTQFPHEIYINEIRKIVKSVDPPPAYGFIHKNNPESRFLRFVAAVLEDGADMIDPAFKDSFKRPLLTEFESEALYYWRWAFPTGPSRASARSACVASKVASPLSMKNFSCRLLKARA